MAPAGEVKKTPPIFQAGFDFGNAFSKAVVRNLDTNRAWAHIFGNGHALLPGCVIHENGRLIPHLSLADAYPHNGLWHLKRALSLGSAWNDSLWADPLARAYAEILGKNFRLAPQGLIFAICAFYLACAFRGIHAGIRARYPDFTWDNGYLLVNMGVPDDADPNVFGRILKLGLSLAQCGKFSGPGMELENLAALIEDLSPQIGANPSLPIVCNIYPESMARAQAFWRAFRTPQDPGAIWLITDAGACNVGQCAFSFSGCGETPEASFYQALSFQHGSSQVERLVASSNPLGNPLEFWRRQKEGADNFREISQSAMQKAITIARGEVERGSKKLYDAMLAGYRQENKEREGLIYLRNNLRFVFLGGGCLQSFYQDGVVNSFNNFVAGNPGACFTAMPMGPDLAPLPQNCEYSPWLATAYGLSFPFMDLQATLPAHM